MDQKNEQIRENLTKWASDGMESAVERLYIGYLESLGADENAVMECFQQLDMVLRGLALKNYDKVWDAACALSDASERRGFCAGLQMGVRLMQELNE